MENDGILEILEKINACIKLGHIDVAKQYIKLEIDNLKGITQERCKNTKYYFYGGYCKYCSNLNCSSNKNEKIWR